MKQAENFENIKLEVQTIGFSSNERIQDRIKQMLDYLTRFSSGRIVYASVFMENKEGKSTEQKSVKVQLGVPGPDIVASSKGDDFLKLLADVQNKLVRQLKK